MNGADHHTIRDMVLFRCNENHDLEIIGTYSKIKSNYIESEGVDLRKSAPNKQFEPIG